MQEDVARQTVYGALSACVMLYLCTFKLPCITTTARTSGARGSN